MLTYLQHEGHDQGASIFMFCRILEDDQGFPCDYTVLEVQLNLGAKQSSNAAEIVGQRLSDLLVSTEKTRRFWLPALAELVLVGGRKTFDQKLQLNEVSYFLTAYVPHKGYLIVLLDEANQPPGAVLASGQILSHSIFDHSPNAIIIYQVLGDGASGKDYIIRGVNPIALETENWKAEDVLGIPLSTARPGVDKFGIIKIFQEVWKTGQSAHYPARVYKDGEEHRWFENVVFKLPTGEIVAVYDDVTDKKRAEEALFAEKEKLKVTLYSIGDGVITTDRQGRIEMINQVTETITGWTQDEARGRDLIDVFDIYSEITGESCVNPVEVVLQTGKIVGLANHTVLRTKEGEERSIADSAAPIMDQEGEILGVVLVFRDVTEVHEQEERIKFLSYRDSLTGLYNRAYFEEELKRVDGDYYYPLSVIIGDLDGLKMINDVFGHQAGDEALLKMADLIKSSCRETDTVARWGGDEFVVLLPNTSEEVGQKICDRIKQASALLEAADTQLSISLGCASKTKKQQSWAEVIKKAEDNMYKGKLLGKSSYRSTVLASIKNSLFAKSYETEEHGERLGIYCREIGRVMGLSTVKIDELQVLAMLHDIGKIGIDDRILQKPGSLTAEEWEIMKTHPEIGYRIAQTVPELANIAHYILAHHERWDGGGYPRGLTSKEIPLQARILSVVDAYDAMTQDRPYRKALSEAAAVSELQRHAGTQFDPTIVEIFIGYLEGMNRKANVST